MGYDSPELGTGLVETTYKVFPHFGSSETYQRPEAPVAHMKAPDKRKPAHALGRLAATVKSWFVPPLATVVAVDNWDELVAFADEDDSADISTDTLEEIREVWPSYDH